VFTHAAPQRGAMCSSAARAVRFGFCPSGPPCAAVRGGRSGPQGNRQGGRFLFAGAGAPSKSPTAPHELAGKAGQRQVGVPFLWHCHHLGGYFSLGKQRKVTGPPAGGRKPAVPQGLPSGRNEPDRRITTTKSQEQSHWTPASAGVTAKEGSDQAIPLTTMKVAMPQSCPHSPKPRPSIPTLRVPRKTKHSDQPHQPHQRNTQTTQETTITASSPLPPAAPPTPSSPQEPPPPSPAAERNSRSGDTRDYAAPAGSAHAWHRDRP